MTETQQIAVLFSVGTNIIFAIHLLLTFVKRQEDAHSKEIDKEFKINKALWDLDGRVRKLENSHDDDAKEQRDR